MDRGRDELLGALAPGNSLEGQSLVVLSPEIGRILAAGERIRFRALGACMYPAVRPGDVLHVQPRTVDEIVPGDMVVCRRATRLFGHRAIAKGAAHGRPYVVTQADRSTSGDDGPVFDDDVLGIVSWIERNGKRLEPPPRGHFRSGRWWLAFHLGLRELRLRSREWAVSGLACVQSLPGYRRAAQPWLASRQMDLRYVVHAPLHAGQNVDLCRRLSPGEFAAIPWYPEADGIDRWILSLFVGRTQTPAASATLVASPVPGGTVRWEVSKVEVRIRYRGMGVEEVLLAEAERILAQRSLRLTQ
jgi:hypothetical protein